MLRLQLHGDVTGIRFRYRREAKLQAGTPRRYQQTQTDGGGTPDRARVITRARPAQNCDRQKQRAALFAQHERAVR